MKKHILSLLVLMIVYSFTNGQKAQENSIVVIGVDTFALVHIDDIRSSQKKQLQFFEQKDYADSLEVEVAVRDKEILERNNLYLQQIERDSLQNKVFYLLKAKYTSLKKDYDKLRKPKLNGIIGGGFGVDYSLTKQSISTVALKINLGLMFKRKYITSLDIGFDLNQQINIGLNGALVF